MCGGIWRFDSSTKLKTVITAQAVTHGTYVLVISLIESGMGPRLREDDVSG
jgi:hypothetical protein